LTQELGTIRRSGFQLYEFVEHLEIGKIVWGIVLNDFSRPSTNFVGGTGCPRAAILLYARSSPPFGGVNLLRAIKVGPPSQRSFGI
jgi:hypothetical protein